MTSIPSVEEVKSALERIDLDERGALDEVVLHGIETAHLERCTRGMWFLNLTREDGSSLAIWISSRPSFEYRDGFALEAFSDADRASVARAEVAASSGGKSDGPRDLAKVACRDMTDAELEAEGARVGRLWDEMCEPDPETGEEFEGRGGSPGEWMIERLDEVNTEQLRRAGAKRVRL